MSNKVLSADKRFINRASDDVGDPQSLAGKISVRDMGTKVSKSQLSGRDSKKIEEVRRPSRPPVVRGPAILDQGVTEGLKYFYSSTPESKQALELIMAWVQSYLEDVSDDITRSATDSIIGLLKDETLKDFDKKKQIESIVGRSISSGKFNEVMNLSKRIPDLTEEQLSMDAEAGIAVTLDSDEENPLAMSDDEDEESDEDQSESSEEENGIAQEELFITTQEKKGSQHDLSAQSIDIYWLQRQLANIFGDAHVVQEKSTQIFGLLDSDQSLGQIENEIIEILNFEHFEFCQLLCKNRDKIVWLTKLTRAQSGLERDSIEREMRQRGLEYVLMELKNGTRSESYVGDMEIDQEADYTVRSTATYQPQIVDLESLAFEEGSRLLTGGKITLPDGTRTVTKSYEEYSIPPPLPYSSFTDSRVQIADLPGWAQAAFLGTYSLNTMQSKVFPVAFHTDENLLICAPTGGGKTNVALLAILRELSHFRSEETGELELDLFKIIYISPLKALVQEQVSEFSKKLAPYGIQVAELTGDSNLTKQQIASTQLIITTPEKYDVVSRKASDTSYINLVRLIIIDEIHLLHDERGPVIENIVARTIMRTEETGEPVRLVGLSATLPNYEDVANFLRVEKGVFYFDGTYRPCPLGQKCIGITEKKAITRYQAMNQACYDKVMDYAGKHQVIIFVHSRKETAKTARYLRDMAQENGVLGQFVKSDIASREILRSESEEVKNQDLKELLVTGFGIHHAGLSRADRNSCEELFRAGRIQVLVSTATLAWGVNLPAHTVIIKGTQVYNPAKGRWTELSPQDVLQMLGRAGRPGFDKSGEGIIITAYSELNYYLSLLNAKLPIESQLMSRLADSINAEIVLGNIRTRQDAIGWLGYSYLYVRMLKSPALYRVGADYADDRLLVRKRHDLCHSAMVLLAKSHLIDYDLATGRVRATELGKFASYFYITHRSMATYNRLLKPFIGPIDIFRIFSLSEEFKYIPVRQEEKAELSKLLERAPIPIKETIEEPSCKINILLQAYISQLKLEGFALMSDMVYVTQSASRLLRALYTLCLNKKWAALSRLTLDICKMVESRMWLSNSPFRQFSDCPAEVIRKTEASQMPWTRYFELKDPSEVGQAIRIEKYGKMVFEYLQQFPRLELHADYQPITHSLIRVELEIMPKFVWNRNLHGFCETFIVLVEDSDGELILFCDTLQLREAYARDPHYVDFTISISEPLPPNCFISVISEKWLHSESRIGLSFGNLILPPKFPPHTPLYDLQPMTTSGLKDPEFIKYFKFREFNKFQTQVFNALYGNDDNVFIGIPTGNGKTVCAELSIMRHWRTENEGKIVYIGPHQQQVDEKFAVWSKSLSKCHGGKDINKLTGELTNDLKIIGSSDIVLATPKQWNLISKRWQRRLNVRNVSLLICDDIHLIGAYQGEVYESVISRMKFMEEQLETHIRIVGLSVPLSNGKDMGQWIGASSQFIYNFSVKEQVIPLEIHLQSSSIPHHPSLMIYLSKSVFYAIQQLAGTDQALIFVDERRQCIETALELFKLSSAYSEEPYLHAEKAELDALVEAIGDTQLKESLKYGIGYIYSDMVSVEKKIVETLFEKNVIQVVLATRETCWSGPAAKLVIIMGTQYYEGKEHRYVDYPVNEILQMIGRATLKSQETTCKALLMTTNSRRDYYRKFLNEALPIESHFNLNLHDFVLSEIREQIIKSRQDFMDWITYSYFFRRLRINPLYYRLTDVSELGISEYLSELIESTLKDLEEAKLIELDGEDGEDSITCLNGGLIASYYDISFITMQTLTLSLSSKTRFKGILEIVTSAAEYEFIPIRTHEDAILSKLYERLPVKFSDAPAYNSPRFKAFVLLQAHMSRFSLPPELVSDQTIVLQHIIRLLSASVDILSSEGHLNAMAAIDLCQMVVQATWDKDSPLKQIPYFDSRIISRCKAEGYVTMGFRLSFQRLTSIETVYDFIAIENDEVRDKILQMKTNDPRVSAIAAFVNKYPNIDISSYALAEDGVVSGEPTTVTVTVDREVDEEEGVDTAVSSQFYPFQKMENCKYMCLVNFEQH